MTPKVFLARIRGVVPADMDPITSSVSDVVSELLLMKARHMEEWCRERSESPLDFERRAWPDGCDEVVHLETGQALRWYPPDPDHMIRWETGPAREVAE